MHIVIILLVLILLVITGLIPVAFVGVAVIGGFLIQALPFIVAIFVAGCVWGLVKGATKKKKTSHKASPAEKKPLQLSKDASDAPPDVPETPVSPSAIDAPSAAEKQLKAAEKKRVRRYALHWLWISFMLMLLVSGLHGAGLEPPLFISFVLLCSWPGAVVIAMHPPLKWPIIVVVFGLVAMAFWGHQKAENEGVIADKARLSSAPAVQAEPAAPKQQAEPTTPQQPVAPTVQVKKKPIAPKVRECGSNDDELTSCLDGCKREWDCMQAKARIEGHACRCANKIMRDICYNAGGGISPSECRSWFPRDLDVR